MTFLTEDFIKEQELSEDQQTAIETASTAFMDNNMADEKKKWDDDLAANGNKYAEGILEGAAKKIEETTSLKRDQGEKIADYLNRSSESFLSTKQSELDKLKTDYEEKMKGVTGADDLQKEIDNYKIEVDGYQKKVAELEPLVEVNDKFTNLTTEHDSLKKEVAFNSVKPVFHKDVNQYEANFKWDEFKRDTLSKFNIEIVDSEPILIDKENKHKQQSLKDLVGSNEDLTALTKGREQGGSGADTTVEAEEIEGVPFKVPKDADSKVRQKLIRDHLATEEILPSSKEYASKFAELNKKILTANK